MKSFKTISATVFIFLLLAAQVFAAGYLTPTYVVPYNVNQSIQDVKVVAYDWCSTSGGIANITVTSKLSNATKGYYLFQADTEPYQVIPGAVPGDMAGFKPTDNYDIYIRGNGWLDISAAKLIDRDYEQRETVKYINYLINDDYGIWISNSGDITKGRIYLYFIPAGTVR